MLANLRALFGVVVDIVLLRRGPEHLPASSVLLAVLVIVDAAITALVASWSAPRELDGSREFAVIGVVVFMTLLWYRVALQMAGKPERFVQTMSAFFAVSIVFTPVILPMMNTFLLQVADAEQTPVTSFGIIALGLRIWLYVIQMRIVRAAFEWTWPPAIVMVLAQEFAVLLAVAALFGTGGDGSATTTA